MKKLNLFVVFLLVVTGLTPLFGQMTARGLGMGGAYTALARGVHAADWNPANLGLPDNRRFTMTIAGLGAGVSNNAFSKSMYDKYLVDDDGDGRVFWTADDVNTIFDAIPDKGLKVVSDMQMRLLSFSIGNFAFSLGAVSGSTVTLEKDIFRIPLKGTAMNDRYDLSGDVGQGLGYGTLDLSYGRQVYQNEDYLIAAGLTTHFMYGAGFAETEDGEAIVSLNPYGADVSGSYEATYAYNGGGLGWGVDLGVAAQFRQGFTVSLALGNLLGSIPFNENVEHESGLFSGDSLGVATDFDEDWSDSTWSSKGKAFSASPPRQLRLGASYQEGPMLVSVELQQGFSDGAMISKTPRFAMGTEYSPLPWLPLRAGVSMGGRWGFSTAFGLGIRPGGFVLDLAVLNRGGLTPGSSKGLSVAFELGIDLAKKD